MVGHQLYEYMLRLVLRGNFVLAGYGDVMVRSTQDVAIKNRLRSCLREGPPRVCKSSISGSSAQAIDGLNNWQLKSDFVVFIREANPS